MKIKKDILIEVVKGVEGHCLYINGNRVAGPKPWGGGQVILKWKTTQEKILNAICGDELTERGTVG